MQFKKLAAALAVVGLIVAGAAPAIMAAAPSVDNETTDTTTTTELDGTSTQTYSTTTNGTLSFSSDSNATAVTVRQGDRELITYENDSDVLTFDTEATGTFYWNATFQDDASDYPGIEVDAGETTTLTFELINDSTINNPDTTNVSITYDNNGNTTFVSMNDSETKYAEDTGSTYRNFLSYGGNDSDPGVAEVTEDDVGVVGDSQDTVIVNIENADAQDSAGAVFDANENSDMFATTAVANFNGELVPVFAEGAEQPDWFDEDMTYATVSEDGQTVTIENAGEALSEDDTEADFTMTTNDAIGVSDAYSLARSYGAGFGAAGSAAGSAIDFNGNPELAEV